MPAIVQWQNTTTQARPDRRDLAELQAADPTCRLEAFQPRRFTTDELHRAPHDHLNALDLGFCADMERVRQSNVKGKLSS